MFGFVIGTLSLIGLIKVVKHGRGWGRGYGYGWHNSGHARRWALRRISYYLDATPGQEKVINEALEQFQAQAEKIRSEMMQSRQEVAASLKGEAFDESKVRSAFERHDALIEQLRTLALEQLQKVHAALEPSQRERLSELMDGSAFARGGGCGWGRGYGHGCGGARRGYGQGPVVNY